MDCVISFTLPALPLEVGGDGGGSTLDRETERGKGGGGVNLE